MSYKASSAESSPRNLKGRISCDSPTHVVSRPGTHSSALHSAWIQRIIPSSSVKKDLELNAPGTRAHLIELQESDDEDLEVNNSDNKIRLPVRKLSEEEELGSASEARFTRTKGGPPSGKLSASSDLKIVPVSDDPLEQTPGHAGDEFHVKIPEALGSSAWFSRITKKEGEPTRNPAEHSFPPLKSGEQWPGTLKPFNLPPLKIPASRDINVREVEPEPHHLPYLTPVNLPPEESHQKRAQSSDVDERETSITNSLPSNFLAEMDFCREKNSQFPERRRHSTDSVNAASSVSDTQSLFTASLHASDEADSESVKKMRHRMRALAATCTGPAPEEGFSRVVWDSIEKSNQLHRGGQSSHFIPPRSKQQQQHDRRLSPEPAAAPASSGKAGLSSRSVQRQQQWLQRWCTPKNPADVRKLH